MELYLRHGIAPFQWCYVKTGGLASAAALAAYEFLMLGDVQTRPRVSPLFFECRLPAVALTHVSMSFYLFIYILCSLWPEWSASSGCNIWNQHHTITTDYSLYYFRVGYAQFVGNFDFYKFIAAFGWWHGQLVSSVLKIDRSRVEGGACESDSPRFCEVHHMSCVGCTYCCRTKHR